MKKLISIILLLAVALLAVSSCGRSGDASDTGAATTDNSGADTTGTAYEPFDYSAALDDNGYFRGVRALDYVELCEYDPIVIPSEKCSFSEETIQSKIDSLLNGMDYSEHVTDRAVENGDKVNIDYVGTIDGVEFEGGSTKGKGTDVTIGYDRYIDDFLDQIVGHMPGDTFDIEVTFPDNYDSKSAEESLNGKDAVFKCTVNYIVVESDLTDEFVEKNLKDTYGCSTVEELRSYALSQLLTNAVASYIQNYIVDSSVFTSVPDVVYQYQVDSMLDYYKQAASYYNVSLEDVIGKSVDELVESYKEYNTNQAKFMLVIQAICEDCDELEMNDKELNDYFQRTFNSTPEESTLISQYGRGYVSLVAMNELVMNYLIDHAQTEAPSVIESATE